MSNDERTAAVPWLVIDGSQVLGYPERLRVYDMSSFVRALDAFFDCGCHVNVAGSTRPCLPRAGKVLGIVKWESSYDVEYGGIFWLGPLQSKEEQRDLGL